MPLRHRGSCPSAEPLSTGEPSGHRWRFVVGTGYLGSLDPAEGSQIQVDDLWIVEEVSSRSSVGVLSLVEDVGTVRDLKASPGILLDHDDRHAGVGDVANPLEHEVLIRR